MTKKEFKKKTETILKQYEGDPAAAELALKFLQLEIFNDISENLESIREELYSISMMVH